MPTATRRFIASRMSRSDVDSSCFRIFLILSSPESKYSALGDLPMKFKSRVDSEIVSLIRMLKFWRAMTFALVTPQQTGWGRGGRRATQFALVCEGYEPNRLRRVNSMPTITNKDD